MQYFLVLELKNICKEIGSRLDASYSNIMKFNAAREYWKIFK